MERAHFVGWAEEYPFVSEDAFQEFVANYREAGVQRFIFSFLSDAHPRRANADGSTATREVLDGFAARSMHELGGRGA